MVVRPLELTMARSARGDAAPTGPVEELQFTLTDPSYPFVGISTLGDGRIDLERMIPRSRGRYAEYFSVTGIGTDQVLAAAGQHDGAEASVLARYADGGLFEFVVEGGCPARHLAERGALPREVCAVGGQGQIVVEVPPGYDAAEIAGAFLDDHPSAELVAKREKDHSTPLFTRRELQRAVDDRLTDRQREVLRTAFEAGYYDCPRRTEGGELADRLGISSATFSEHIRAAESNILTILYEG
jgi:predicted DNA binding protein